jgi:glutathione S-transferase
MGEIPVLEDNGEKLTQTGPILLRLADRYQKLGGSGEAERFEVLRWLFWDNQKLSAHMATYRFMRTFSRNADPAVLAFLRARVDDFLGILDRQLAAQPFVAGRAANIADISMCAYLSYPADETGYDLASAYPNIHAWLERIAALPAWRSPYDLLPGQKLPRFDIPATQV